MITGGQIRAARAAAGWSMSELSRRGGVSLSTIKRAEAVDGVPKMTYPNNRSIRETFELCGIEFIGTAEDRPGIRIISSRDVGNAPDS
jgi:transcriptional regulator with XRE-family HTH domain